jgi:transposase
MPGKGCIMATPRTYPDELKRRAVRMVREIGERGAIKRVAEQLDINPETLRNWVRRSEVDDGERPGMSTEQAAELVRLRKENAELERANEILKAASAFFARELCATRRRVCREVVRDHFRWAVAAD